MSKTLYLEIDKLVRETEKAYLISKDGHEMWFPKSQSQLGKPPHICDNPLRWLSVSEWIRYQKLLDIPKSWRFFSGYELIGENCDDDLYSVGEWEVL